MSFSGLYKIPLEPMEDINSYYLDERFENYYQAFDTLLVPYGGRVLAFANEDKYFFSPYSFSNLQ